jgi:hypothetical protein
MVKPHGGDLQRQIAVYQVLHERYVSNAGLQWQVAVYIIAAQAALLAGVVAARSAGIRLSLGVADAIVGIAGILVCRRIELTAWVDREHLDRIEEAFLPGDPLFHLHHDDSFVERVDRHGLSVSERTGIRRLDLRIARRVAPGFALALLMAILGAASIGVAVFAA